MENLIKAMNEAMKELPLIGKNLEVGFGRNTYKGVSWSDVAGAFNPALKKNGLVIVPTNYDIKTSPECHQDPQSGKLKYRVFVEVNATYKIYHTSGECIEVSGAGQGVDTQDKAVGKATTYAYKNMLMYMFTVAGDMDDTDLTHSDDLPAPAPPKITAQQAQELINIAQTKNQAELNKMLNGTQIKHIAPEHFDGWKQALMSLPQ